MRISLITETYFPQVNGVSRALGQLARVLRDAGDRVQVVHPDYGNGLAPGHPDDLPVRSVRVPFYREVHLPGPPFGGAFRAIQAFEPDLVHIATEGPLGLAVHRRGRRLGLPIVSSFHTNFDQYTRHYGVGFARGLIWRYLRWFHNATLETYVPSNATIEDLRNRGFERLVLWPRGVDAHHFRPDRPARERIRAALGFPPDSLVIGHVSRIAAEKNVEYLGEALLRVEQARPNVRILIVGDGPARPSLEERLGESARFVGYRTGDDLADHYAACDLFAFASLTETFGNVILEAMASGLPVVAVRAGGPGDIVRPGVTGCLVEPTAPPDDFARELIALIDHPEQRRAMAAEARRHALEQSWDAIMIGLRGRYQACLEQASAVMA